VLVYGLQDSHPKDALQLCNPSLRLQLIKSGLIEQSVFKGHKMLGEMIQISSPMSTSNLLFPQYGRRVAEALQRQQCDIVHIQHCSQWDEGFGIPPIEAMVAGLPTVGTLSGALPETVKDGVTGFLVEKSDPRALAERILRLLRDDDLRESMGHTARRHVLTTFTWERAADSLESRYRWLLHEQPCQIDREVQSSPIRTLQFEKSPWPTEVRECQA
jgi:hypothetical protein